jgi:hypothetical protein
MVRVLERTLATRLSVDHVYWILLAIGGSFSYSFSLYDARGRLRTRNQRTAELSKLFDQQFEQISDAKQKSAHAFQWIGGRTCALWMILLKVAELAMAVAADNDRFVTVCLSGDVVALQTVRIVFTTLTPGFLLRFLCPKPFLRL